MYDYNKIDDFHFRAEEISKANDADTAFALITAEIEQCEDRYLNDYIGGLNFIRSEKVLDWVEQNAHRAVNLSGHWGHLAASSHFNWQRAQKWLSSGRPLSLIALDALAFCTTQGPRLNQSPWMQEIKPTLEDHPDAAVVAHSLQKHLATDAVPRTKKAVDKIIQNLFDVRS